MIRITMSVVFAALGLVVFIWKRRDAKTGPQERRLKAGDVRVPNFVGTHKRPRAQGTWALYIAVPIGGLAVTCFFAMKIMYGYHAAVLMDRGQPTMAAVIIDGMPKEDCHYEFSVNEIVYHGRGPEEYDKGKSLRVLYDPTNPKRNRPADGLWLDIVTAVLLAGGLVVVLGMAIIPHRRFRGHDAALVRQLQGELQATVFDKAIDTFRAMEESRRHGSVLALADAITTICCARGERDVYEQGQEAIQILAEGESDPAIQRELRFYQQEIAASGEICGHHQMVPGESGADHCRLAVRAEGVKKPQDT